VSSAVTVDAVKVVEARKTSSSPLLSRGTKLLAKESKLTVVPSWLIDGTRLLLLAGVEPEPAPCVTNTVLVVHSVVIVSQVFRAKIFSTPFVMLAKLDEKEANATYWPVLLILGYSLVPFPGTPLVVTEISVVDGVHAVRNPMHVSRK
jgi:hypothetical protein